MTAQEDALSRLAAFLDRARVPCMVIGGIANIVWGEPRATLDIDVTVLVEAGGTAAFIDLARGEYRVLVENPLEFIRDTSRVARQGLSRAADCGDGPIARARRHPHTLAGVA